MDNKPRDKSLRRRLVAFGVVAGVILLIFLLRLVQFQLVDGADYRRQAEAGSLAVSDGRPAPFEELGD